MKRPTMLVVQALLKQLAIDLDLSVERDVRSIGHRFEHEGFSFLTITLPLLSDALERGLELGTFSCPTQFSRSGSLPRLLGGFFKRVFDKDGRLLLDPCPFTIAGIRQVCRFFKKLKLGCTPEREALASAQFLAIEDELRNMTSQVERKDILLDQISGIIWAQVFPELDYVDLVCSHGPGVTADRYLSNERYRIRKWNQRSEHSFPSDLHCFPNYGVAAEEALSQGTEEGGRDRQGIEYLELQDEEPVRVVFVPKTQSAPRVIAIEPSHMQYIQQSVKDYIYATIEGHSLTKRSIRFSDQTVNQRLAYRSSKDKRLATLDLKDASDRVHLHLVQRIFKTSGLLPYLEDARSLHAVLPNGSNVILSKYASMGSALCFPVEAMVFYTLIQVAMHRQDGRRPNSRSISEYSRKIDIYGDDIIVPVEYTDNVVHYLESYALRVNLNKSFRFSNFRESCGADFYNGVDTKPVYARMPLYEDARQWGAEELMSWCATADQFYLKGQWHVCQEIRDLLCRVTRRTIPRSREPGEGLVFFSLLFSTRLRFNRELQSWKQKRLLFHPTKRKDEIDGNERACLNKWGIHTELRSRRTGGYLPNSLRGSSELRGPGRLSSSDRGVPDWYLNVDAEVCDSNLCLLSGIRPRERGFSSSILWTLAEGRTGISADPLGYHRTSHLASRRDGLNFDTSIKRGTFKSKSQWVNLQG